MVKMGGLLLLGLLLLTGCSSRETRFAEKMEQANENLENGEVLKAIKMLEQLKTQYPGHPQILELLAFSFVEAKDFYTGAFYFNQLAKTYPENIDYYLYSAQAWVNAGDTEAAIQDYEAYLLENQSDWNTWEKIGDLYLETGQKSKAIHAYSNSSRIKPDSELDLKAALLANEIGNLRQAETGYERLLTAKDPKIAKEAHAGLIQIKHKRRQWEEVEKLVTSIEKRFPDLLDSPDIQAVQKDYATFNKAKIEEAQRIKEEEERRQRVLDQERQRAERLAAARRAATLQSQEESQPREEVPPSNLVGDVEEPGETEPPEEKTEDTPNPPQPPETKPSTPFQLALAEARRIASTHSDEAVAKYWDAINAGDDSGVAFYELARLYYHRRQYSEAEMTSLEALRRNPRDNRFLLTYLQIIRKTKAKPDVVEEIRKYRRIYPRNPDLVLLLARIYAEPDGDAVSARSLYNKFFEMAPNHPEFEQAKYEARGI